MPDTWESLHGFDPLAAADADQDTDNDGLTNLEEYRAGTDPRDASSRLRLDFQVDADGMLEIGFRAVAGISYTVESRDQLDATAWTTLLHVDPEAVGRDVAVTISASESPHRYYRVVSPRRP